MAAALMPPQGDNDFAISVTTFGQIEVAHAAFTCFEQQP